MLASYEIEEYEFLDSILHALQLETIHPSTRVQAKEIMQQTILTLLRWTFVICQSGNRVEATQEDFAYALDLWIRNLNPQRSYLLLGESYLQFSTPDGNLENSEGSDEENDSTYEVDSDEDARESDQSDLEEDDEEEVQDDDDEEDEMIEDDDEDIDISSRLFDSESDQLSDIDTGSDESVGYSPLVKVQRFRKYCQKLLFTEVHSYLLFHDDVLISLHKFLFDQFTLSFQSNALCLLSRAGYPPLGLLNQNYCLEQRKEKENNDKHLADNLQHRLATQQEIVQVEQKRSNRLVDVLQDLIATLQSIPPSHSPSVHSSGGSSDKENKEVVLLSQSLASEGDDRGDLKNSQQEGTSLSSLTEKKLLSLGSDHISIPPIVLDSLARRLQESERRIEVLQESLRESESASKLAPSQSTPSTSLLLSAKREGKLKGLIQQLNSLISEEEEEEENNTDLSKTNPQDIPTEALHRYPLVARDIEDDEDDQPHPATTVKMDLLGKFALASPRNEKVSTTQTSSSFHPEITSHPFHTHKRKHEETLDSSSRFPAVEQQTQYLVGTPGTMEKLEAQEKRMRTESSNQASNLDPQLSTPSIFDRRKL